MINDRSPSDWFVRFADGTLGYIRYRWGTLSCETMHVPPQMALDDPALMTADGTERCSEQIGAALDSEITLEDACAAMGMSLRPTAIAR